MYIKGDIQYSPHDDVTIVTTIALAEDLTDEASDMMIDTVVSKLYSLTQIQIQFTVMSDKDKVMMMIRIIIGQDSSCSGLIKNT